MFTTIKAITDKPTIVYTVNRKLNTDISPVFIEFTCILAGWEVMSTKNLYLFQIKENSSQTNDWSS